MEIILGAKYCDEITGFEGIATGHVKYLTGCNQVLLRPRCLDGEESKYPEAQWIDEQRLVQITKFNPIILENGDNPGFDKMAPRK